MGLQGQRYEKISRSPRILRAAPRLFFNFRTVGWFIVCYNRASGVASSVFPRFASSVLSVRFKRAPGSLQACSPGIRFKRVENEPACCVKHHCRRLTLHRGAIAVESPRDCGWTASHRETFFSFSRGGRDPHASHRRTVAPSHKAGSDMRRGNGRKWDYRVKIYYIIIYYYII